MRPGADRRPARHWRPLLAALALALAAGLARAQATEAPDCHVAAAVCDAAVPGALALIRDGRPLPVLDAADDFPGVRHAAQALRGDLAQVAGSTAVRTDDGTAIIVGTLGRSARIDRIVRERHIDTRDLAGRWEAYLLQVVERPEPGIGRALLIVGADKRGSIFGIYELSRRLGVSPWNWWADVPVARRAQRHIASGRLVDAPSVHWRGIFLNDEDPALGGWMQARFGGPNHRFYAHVFDLILRLKGNTLWPAMWGRAFADDDSENPRLADTLGVVIGSSHHEPMLRAHVEWQRHGHGPWDYTRNAAALDAFWRAGIQRMDGHESLVTIGMRGDGDEPMTQGTATRLLEDIITDQRRIIAEVTGKPAAATPQVWALYKEVQDYFDAGLRVPDDVTLLFSDDNWGNLRRLPPPGATRAGGYGIYYHFDYVGGPRNYKWINSTQIERTWEQMQLAWAYGARQLWIVNVGDLKPLEFPISFFLDHAWNPAAFTPERLARYPAEWAGEQFGSAHAAAIGEILTRYAQYNARRKPELLDADTFSLDDADEMTRVLAGWDDLVARTEALGATLAPAQHAAWYQLVAYPVLASANLNHLYAALARNRRYAAQGRAGTRAEAETVRRRFARDAELARIYEQDIAGGKWTHMMSQPRIGYSGWQQPERNLLPALEQLKVPAAAALGVALEGDARAWPGPAAAATLPVLDPWGSGRRTLEVFNRGRAPLDYHTEHVPDWLHVTPAAGRVNDQQRLAVTVDWARRPADVRAARFDLVGSDGRRVSVTQPLAPAPPGVQPTGFVESAGRIAIEAPHHARAVAADGLAWLDIPQLGRTLGGVTSQPTTAPASPPDASGAWLEYPIWLWQASPLTLRVRVSPSADFLHRGGGLRFAVSLDDTPPQVLHIAIDPEPGHAGFAAWEQAVSEAVYTAHARLAVDAPGAHVLKLWRIDPGVVFQRLELDRGEPGPAYLGAPESRWLEPAPGPRSATPTTWLLPAATPPAPGAQALAAATLPHAALPARHRAAGGPPRRPAHAARNPSPAQIPDP